MEYGKEFKDALQKKGDFIFSKLRSEYIGKVNKDRSIIAAADNINLYEKVLVKLTDKLAVYGNELYPTMKVAEEDVQNIFVGVIKSYLPKIKELSGF